MTKKKRGEFFSYTETYAHTPTNANSLKKLLLSCVFPLTTYEPKSSIEVENRYGWFVADEQEIKNTPAIFLHSHFYVSLFVYVFYYFFVYYVEAFSYGLTITNDVYDIFDNFFWHEEDFHMEKGVLT